jgi:glycosyltransferase involved in cell wall biosynthesis
MRILDVWAHVNPQFGGVGPAASAMSRAVRSLGGWAADEIAVCGPSETQPADDISASIQTVVSAGMRPLADFSLTKTLRRAVADCDVVHVHGMWLAHSIATRRLAQMFGKPVVSSVHGMLERWDLANKRVKKSLYSAFVERPSLARSACLRALSLREVEDYRNYGLRNTVALIPNGAPQLARVETAELIEHMPQLRDKQVVLYLSRIHRKKGILRLLEAWPHIRKKHSDAHLLVAGADFDGSGTLARQTIEGGNMRGSVTFCGVLSGNRKLEALSLARCFCLPSFSEGMSVAVLEALSIGSPVVITPACNVDGVDRAGAGFVTSNDPGDLAEHIGTCLGMSGASWATMSSAASALARERYDWAKVGRQMASVYEWLMGGPRPMCVVD